MTPELSTDPAPLALSIDKQVVERRRTPDSSSFDHRVRFQCAELPDGGSVANDPHGVSQFDVDDGTRSVTNAIVGRVIAVEGKAVVFEAFVPMRNPFV